MTPTTVRGRDVALTPSVSVEESMVRSSCRDATLTPTMTPTMTPRFSPVGGAWPGHGTPQARRHLSTGNLFHEMDGDRNEMVSLKEFAAGMY